jgi:hypothetical protein
MEGVDRSLASGGRPVSLDDETQSLEAVSAVAAS